MVLRRGFFVWLFPAALVLPVWLLIGWGIFTGGGLAFLWVLFVACPSVFLGQILIALLIRARGTVRASRAVSWWDALGLTIWHGLTIAVGFYNDAWFAPVLVGAILAGFALIWSSMRQLSAETRPVALRYTTLHPDGSGTWGQSGQTRAPRQSQQTPAAGFAPPAGEVFVIEESDGTSR